MTARGSPSPRSGSASVSRPARAASTSVDASRSRTCRRRTGRGPRRRALLGGEQKDAARARPRGQRRARRARWCRARRLPRAVSSGPQHDDRHAQPRRLLLEAAGVGDHHLSRSDRVEHRRAYRSGGASDAGIGDEVGERGRASSSRAQVRGCAGKRTGGSSAASRAGGGSTSWRRAARGSSTSVTRSAVTRTPDPRLEGRAGGGASRAQHVRDGVPDRAGWRSGSTPRSAQETGPRIHGRELQGRRRRPDAAVDVQGARRVERAQPRLEVRDGDAEPPGPEGVRRHGVRVTEHDDDVRRIAAAMSSYTCVRSVPTAPASSLGSS